MTMADYPKPGGVLGGRFRRIGVRDASAEAVVAASPDAVWAFVSDPDQIGRWWPRAVGGLVTGGEEEGAGREQIVRLDWGRVEGVVKQRVTEWQPPAKYGWLVLSEQAGDRVLTPLAEIRVTVRITREGPLSRVAISGEFRPAGARGALAVRQLARTARRTYKSALKNLQAALAQH